MPEYVHPDGGVAPSDTVPSDVEKSTDTVPAMTASPTPTRPNKTNLDNIVPFAFMVSVYQNKPNMSKRDFKF